MHEFVKKYTIEGLFENHLSTQTAYTLTMKFRLEHQPDQHTYTTHKDCYLYTLLLLAKFLRNLKTLPYL